jgi:hypothetical protein
MPPENALNIVFNVTLEPVLLVEGHPSYGVIALVLVLNVTTAEAKEGTIHADSPSKAAP